MKKIILIAAIALMGSMGVFAQKYAIIDTRFILDKMPEYKAAQEQLDNIAQEWQKDIDARQVKLDQLYKNYEAVPREKLADEVSNNLLQVKPGISMDLIKQYSDQTGRENFIRTATLQIMSTPEYQLC